jgi:hypothetical protein
MEAELSWDRGLLENHVSEAMTSSSVSGRRRMGFYDVSKLDLVVGHHRMWQDPLSILWIPIMPGGDGCNLQRFRYDEVLRRTGEKIEERLPGSVGLRLIQSLERHVKQQCVIGSERDRLAPMGIKERLVIEAHERAHQFAERGVGVRPLSNPALCRRMPGAGRSQVSAS